MGGYGIFRINLGILPDATKNLWWVLAILGTISMVYAAFVCLAQVDLKRLIAYSSIGHMGFVLLGASSLTVIGVQGAIFQLFNHGIITAILFMLAGSVKHATGTRDIPELQGLAKVMPQFSLVLAIGFFASAGLPSLNSFWSEFMVFLGAYESPNLVEMRALIIIPLISIVVTAAYYVYTLQRILFGDVPEKLGHPHDLLPWERVSYAVLVALVFLVAFLPFLFLGMINAYTSGSFPWLGGLEMLIDFPILTYIVLLPAVRAVFTYLAGSDRAARPVALGFSVIVLGLSTVLLTGFLCPSGISLPAITTAANHTYFPVEASPGVPSLNVNYVLGADE